MLTNEQISVIGISVLQTLSTIHEKTGNISSEIESVFEMFSHRFSESLSHDPGGTALLKSIANNPEGSMEVPDIDSLRVFLEVLNFLEIVIESLRYDLIQEGAPLEIVKQTSNAI